MKLHENLNLFKEAITTVSQQTGLSEIYIEKDYWVTLALHTIFTSEIGESVIFKGGTALAKCFQIIERFSEDIDLVILRKPEDTGNQLKKKLRHITKLVSAKIPEIELEGITNKMGMIRKTAHNYEKKFEGIFHQARSNIIIESTWLGHFEPFTTAKVSSYIYDMMIETGQEDLIKEYCLEPFTVKVLDPKRTLCEKIMSLVRFSHTTKPVEDLNNKIRHIYDIHKMFEKEEIRTFFDSNEFENMLIRVGNDDVIGFKNNNEWLKIHPKNALLFAKSTETWTALQNTYHTTFSELVYGILPNEADILKTIKNVAKRLEHINWTLDF